MTFDDLIAPLTRPDFLDRFRQGACFFIKGEPDRFRDLITLQEIEDRLNEGCNLNNPVNMVLANGTRGTLVETRNYWTPLSLKKREILTMLEQRHSFVMMNMSQINPRVAALMDEIENVFADDRLHGDLHLYVSASRNASAYNAHRDIPQHKIYLQVIGATDWEVFDQKHPLPDDLRAVVADAEAEHLVPKARFTLNPGDLFYMPPGVFHKVRNRAGPRVSFSIPLVAVGPEHPRVDRTYIPFKAMFERELKDAANDQRTTEPAQETWLRSD